MTQLVAEIIALDQWEEPQSNLICWALLQLENFGSLLCLIEPKNILIRD